MDKLYTLSHDALYDLLFYYNAYIQKLNDCEDFRMGIHPVQINEFYRNESGGDSYKEWKKNSEGV